MHDLQYVCDGESRLGAQVAAGRFRVEHGGHVTHRHVTAPPGGQEKSRKNNTCSEDKL